MVVGPTGNTRTWHLPKKLLVNASPFFAAALNGSFAEATSKVINLPEDNTDAFALFVRWLFVGDISGDLFISDGAEPGDEILGTCEVTESDVPFAKTTMVYLQAWVLEDKLGCLVFLNLVMFELHAYYRSTSETILFIYEQSGPGSKLRLLAIDEFRYDLQNGALDKYTASRVSTSKIAEEFGLDFLKVCLDCKNAIRPTGHKQRYVEVLTTTDEG